MKFPPAAALLLAVTTILLTPASSVAQSAEDHAAVQSLDDLSWLLGSWEMKTARTVMVEKWSRVSDNTYEGIGTSIRDGQPGLSEYLRLVQFGTDIFYTAKPDQNPLPASFKMVSGTISEIVFENTTHDFPQKITYTRIGVDSMMARIEGPMDGQNRSIDFKYQRKQ